MLASRAQQPEPTDPELVARARALVPELRERAARCEEQRRIPAESVAATQAAGLFRVLQPRRFGGLERDYAVMAGIAYELGRGCGSTAWVYQNLCSHQLILGFFPLEAQSEFWGADPSALASTGWASKHARAVPVEGGYRLSGRWEFSSGVHHAQGVLVLAPIEGREIRPGIAERRIFLLHREHEARVEEVWDVVGLCGTGSDDVSAEDVFVPEHRSLSLAAASRHGERVELQGSGVHSSRFYRIPFFTWFPFTVAPALVGIAQGGLEHTLERLRTRTNLFGQKLGENAAVQVRIATASAKIDAAQLLIERSLREMAELADREEVPSVALRGRFRRDAGYAAVLAYEAVGSLFYRGGAHGIFRSDALARAYRDVGAGATHLGADFDLSSEIWAQAIQGLPVTNPNF
jgi:3-hydroxy-9,10-secoandrosta-1,3,5(10)-triene-9,17-dione monooxygenase